MSTRSITSIRTQWADDDEWQTCAVIYRHHDGYLSGHGEWLFNFLDGLVVINGIPANPPERFANGAGRLAGQLVARLQKNGHDPNLMGGTIRDCGQEFHYQVDVGPDLAVTVEVFEGPMTAFGIGGEDCTDSVFKGTVAEYGAYLSHSEEGEST